MFGDAKFDIYFNPFQIGIMYIISLKQDYVLTSQITRFRKVTYFGHISDRYLYAALYLSKAGAGMLCVN